MIQKLETLGNRQHLAKRCTRSQSRMRCWQELVRRTSCIKCFDDITGKELLWQAVKQAREQEFKYLRELGVCEKVDERAAVAKYNVTPVDTK